MHLFLASGDTVPFSETWIKNLDLVDILKDYVIFNKEAKDFNGRKIIRWSLLFYI